jgi:hypothetical protein
VIPKEVLFVFVSKLKMEELTSILNLYPLLSEYDNMFKYLVKIRFSKIFDILNSVYNDINEKYTFKPKWYHIYKELLIHENDEGFDYMLDDNDFL